ncbi:MAG: (2Fe-2S) ferredoxin domain-containing protein [Erysipelotrichaceae bacterium]|nr:(2Fe-2S) ferredoxin domain-containing protein [Erysipelotrichaceae bacterium]
MLKITVCIGSACHLKGSREIVERLQALIKKEKLTEEIELKGTFCLGNCQKDGVSITIDDQYHNVLKDDIDTFFEQYILNH